MNESGTPAYIGSDMPIEITVEVTQAGRCVLYVAGEIDMLTVPRLREVVLDQLSGSGINDLVIDLNGVSFIGSLGLGALVEFSKTANQANTALRLVCEHRQVLRPLALTGLDQVLPTFQSHAELPSIVA